MSADLVWGWATFGFVLMVPGTLWVGHYDRRLLRQRPSYEVRFLLEVDL